MPRSRTALVLLTALGVVTLGATRAPRSSVAVQAQPSPVMDSLPIAGGVGGAATAINDAGQIVGWITTEAGHSRATLWEHGGKKVVDLGTPDSVARDINRSGDIVGSRVVSLPDGPLRAVLWKKGKLIELGTLGGIGSAAYRINDRGQVVGSASIPSGETHAFLWEDGVMTDLGDIDPYVYAYGINNRGQMAGSRPLITTSAWTWIPILLQDGVLTDLDSLAGPGGSGRASDITEAGQIVGSSQTDGSGAHATLWDHGRTVDLGTLGGPTSSAEAASNNGLVVGISWSFVTDWINHAFLYADGKMTDLAPVPAEQRSWAYGVNNQGWVVGSVQAQPYAYEQPVLWRRR